MKAKSFLLLLCFAKIAPGAIINSDYATGGWSIDSILPTRGGTFRAQENILQSFTISLLQQSDPHAMNVFVGGTDASGAPDGSRLWQSGQFESAVGKFTFAPDLPVLENEFYFLGIQVIDPEPGITSVRFGVTYGDPRYYIDGNVWSYASDGTLSPATEADIATTVTLTSVPEPSILILSGIAIPLWALLYFRNRSSPSLK